MENPTEAELNDFISHRAELQKTAYDKVIQVYSLQNIFPYDELLCQLKYEIKKEGRPLPYNELQYLDIINKL